MAGKGLLDGKKILIVDDETDVLDTLQELLTMCEVLSASDFDKAKELLGSQHFDIAVLDIMGVNGYELLRLANEKRVMAIMLTAHALSPDNLVRSFNEGAAYYVPKDEIFKIAIFLEDVLEAKQKGNSLWSRWLDRFSSFFEKRFGPDWVSENKEFLDNLKYRV
jgi:DNA-binding NtrC family response regulator